MLRPGVAYSPAKALAERYQVTVYTIYSWARFEDFPKPDGVARKRVWPDREVDAWVKQNRHTTWADAQSDEPFASQGDPDDLLSQEEIAQVRAERYGSEAVSAATMRAYRKRGWLPDPDRTPGDGLEPPVAENRWYRRTVDAHVGAIRGPGNRSANSRGLHVEPAKRKSAES